MADLYGQVILVAEEKYFIAESVARVLEQSGADVLGPAGTLGGALTLLEVLGRVDGAEQATCECYRKIRLRVEKLLPGTYAPS